MSKPDDSSEVLHPLLGALSPPQQQLIDTVAEIAFGQPWLTFDYVARRLRRQGLDAQSILTSFPVATNHLHGSMPYRHFWTAGGAAIIQQSNTVQLTIAGLRHAGAAGRQYGDLIVQMIGKLAEVESEIIPDPHSVLEPDFDLMDALKDCGGSRRYEEFIGQIAEVLEREPPTLNGPFKGGPSGYMIRLRNDMSPFIGVTDCDEYLERVIGYLGSNLPPAISSVIDTPMAIVDELGYLDAIWEARLKDGPLLGRVQLGSASGLVRGCASQDEFNARMNALYDILNGIHVNLAEEAENISTQEKERPLQRLRRKIRPLLAPEVFEQADVAITVLQKALRIRSSVHSGVQRELPSLYGALGLQYPLADLGTAWD